MQTPALDRIFVQLRIKWLLDPEPSMDNTEDNDVHSQQEVVDHEPDDYPPYPTSFPQLVQRFLNAERARHREEER